MDLEFKITGLICPDCLRQVNGLYSFEYLKEKALPDAEIEVCHNCPGDGDLHCNTVKLSLEQLHHIRTLLWH
jgi:hypothetical protein